MNACSVCRHPERLAIETLLVRHTPLRKVAAQFGVGYQSVNRHQQHVHEKLQKARDGIEMADARSLLLKVDEVLADARRITRTAEKKGELQTALQGLRTITQSLALLGRITGEIQQGPSLQFHAHVHTQSAEPQSEAEIDLQVARCVQEATSNFNPEEIARLQRLAQGESVLTLEGTV